MKFGAIEQDQLDGHNFSMPSDHSQTAAVLAAGNGNMNVHCGCAKWGRKEWIGTIYPEGTKDKDFLAEYVKHFNGIEMNTTFYSIKRENVEKWTEKAPPGFKFSPKFNRTVSHTRRLNEKAYDYLEYFMYAIEGFGEHLGPSFLQLPESFTSSNLDRLEQFAEYVPDDIDVFVEFRDASWFEGSAFDETFAMLAQYGLGAVITDVGTRRDVLHQRLTIPKAFVRFNGYGLHPSDYQRMDDWIQRIKEWQQAGIEEVHWYAHQQDETDTPVTCDYFIENLNKACGLTIKRPDFIN